MSKIKNILSTASLITALSLAGCSKEKEQPAEITVNESTYTQTSSNILQTKSSFLNDNTIKIGLVSDIEGAVENAQASARKLKSQNLDAIIIAGDTYENEQIRVNPLYPYKTDNVKEMVEGIQPYAELNIPVFIIPGNHEQISTYVKGIKILQQNHKNVFDINRKSVDLQGFNIVGMGGYHISRPFMPPQGFFLWKEDYQKAEKDMQEYQLQKEPIIFVTHGPPSSNTKIDYVPSAGHVGDIQLARIMNSTNLENIINVHGHIHEGGRNTGEYKAGTAINVASITSYNNQNSPNTLILEIKEGKVSLQEAK